jgi:serine-type D-Ala-D-Ala carboxypeptidase/endopeptidase (penicillin-binding protein 4)
MFKLLHYFLITLTALSALSVMTTQAQEIIEIDIIETDIGDIPPRVQRVLDGHNLPASSVSFFVREVGAADPLLAFNADQPMNPASAVKTITTIAALETLGPAFTWKTELYALGSVADGILQGDLLLKGGGDPFLVEEQLRSMLKALQRTGIEYITGNLVLDGSYFDPSVEQEDDLDNQGGRSYNTNPNAVISNFQSVAFYFYPDPNGRNVIIHTDPQLPNLKIENRLRQVNGSCRGYQRGISFNINQNDSTEVIFEGQFPSGCLQYQMTREVLDAPGYTFGLFNELWEELGGDLAGRLMLGEAPDNLEPILIWSSSPLSDVIKSINKFSNNLMTRHLLLTLGAELLGSPATVEKGIETVQSYLELKGLASNQLQLSNGAGLSRETRVSTSLLGDILQTAYTSAYMPEYIASLPINGLDGTMRNRLRGDNMTGRMHVKTGTLDEVSAVAGYVYSRSNKTFVVSGIINHELADRGPGVELMDALLTWVYLQ